MSIFCEKYQFSKTKVLSHHFFQICHEKPPVVVQIFTQKTSISVKITPSYGPNISIGWLFSRFFTKKFFHEKNHCSHARIF